MPPTARFGVIGFLFFALVLRCCRKNSIFRAMTTTISSKGQIVLPADIRQQDDIKPGQKFDVERVDRGEYVLKRKARRRNEGLVDWLLNCPEKGWFQPLDRTETTDDIQLPGLG